MCLPIYFARSLHINSRTPKPHICLVKELGKARRLGFGIPREGVLGSLGRHRILAVSRTATASRRRTDWRSLSRGAFLFQASWLPVVPGAFLCLRAICIPGPRHPCNVGLKVKGLEPQALSPKPQALNNPKP